MVKIKMEFFVPGTPRGKGRPKFTRSGHAYTDDKTRNYERFVAACFRKKNREWRTDSGSPVSMFVTAFYKIPKSWTKAKKQAAMDGDITPGKPDVDNIAKIVMDSLNKLAYLDDKQVNRLSIRKQFCNEQYTEEGVSVVVLTGEDAR